MILEADLVKSFEYCELSENNYCCYSARYTQMLISIASEFEVICRELYKIWYTSEDRVKDKVKMIQKVLLKIQDDYLPEGTKIHDVIIKTKYHAVDVSPFQTLSYDKGTNMNWKNACNTLKHERQIGFETGNLENTINAIAALFFVETVLIMVEKDQDKASYNIANKQSNLFILDRDLLPLNAIPLSDAHMNV